MSISRLYPTNSTSTLPLNGAYLALSLHREKNIHIYSNYIASMDGRISLRDKNGKRTLPTSLANSRDWRLYQELAAQADAVLVSGRYIRSLATGCAQDLLPVSQDAAYADIHDWRNKQELNNPASVIIVSNSLDLPLDILQDMQKTRSVFVVSSNKVSATILQTYAKHNIPCIILGQQQVEGRVLRAWLEAQGFQSVYMIAGPHVHHTLLAAGMLDTLFLTQNFCLLGGDATDIDTILWGELPQAKKMKMQHCYLDTIGQQLFMRFSLRK
ncbi:MAG: dihydrofolate reductase family protein [Mariprofundales bacterium]